MADDVIAVLFALGTKTEDMGETYVAEVKNLEAMKVAFAMIGKALEDHKAGIKDAVQITVKEQEYGDKYVGSCIDIVKKFYNDVEAKRLQAIGGSEAMARAVAGIKAFYDEATNQRIDIKEKKVKKKKSGTNT